MKFGNICVLPVTTAIYMCHPGQISRTKPIEMTKSELKVKRQVTLYLLIRSLKALHLSAKTWHLLRHFIFIQARLILIILSRH